jgi:hypothetical protein
VEDRKSVEEWADALLDQHRARPRPAPGAGRAERSSLDDQPPMVRLAAKLSGEPPDPYMLERLRRNGERFATLQKIDTVVTIISIVVFGLLALAAFSAFT